MLGFEQYMNPPESTNGEAYTRYLGAEKWVFCLWCGKKQFPVAKETTIRKMKWKCKSSTCKKEFEINI